MSFKFPFTNYHELNLTWVLDQLKKLFEESAENVSTIQNYDGRLTAVETELPTVSETASEASRSAAAAGTLAQSAKATADTAQKNAVQAQSLAGTARQEAQNAQTAANAATQAAQQAQATAQNFDGRITQAENDASQALEASRSFENRVQSAITTANNAARTATDAQGVAQNANQNAAAAQDKIGDLSALDTTAKQNLVAAINEALENGGKVDSVNGQTGAVILDAGDIGYNDSTVETALDGKQNAPTAAGTAGQILGLNAALEPVWLNSGSSAGDDLWGLREDILATLFPAKNRSSIINGSTITQNYNKISAKYGSSSTGTYQTFTISANTWRRIQGSIGTTDFNTNDVQKIKSTWKNPYIKIYLVIFSELLAAQHNFRLLTIRESKEGDISFETGTTYSGTNYFIIDLSSYFNTYNKIGFAYQLLSRNATGNRSTYFDILIERAANSAATTNALALSLDK